MFTNKYPVDKYLFVQIILQQSSAIMLSSGFGFPTQDFLTSLRNNRNPQLPILQQTDNLNSHWVYQVIKHCHNIILDIKQQPATKLAALQTVKQLMETSQVPCINLIQAYILPIAYQVSIEKPQEQGERRGSNFFMQQTKSSRIPNLQQNGIKFVRLCSELVYTGSITKTKRSFENQQLNRISEFADYYEKLKKYGISNTPKAITDIKQFSEQFIKNGRQKYLKNLHNFSNEGMGYVQYMVTKIIDSLQSDTNPLFNNTNSSGSAYNQLDMRKLLKQGDSYITSPLIQQLLIKLKHSENMMIKKNCLSLLSDFFKWGDIEAISKICSTDAVNSIGNRIAEVNGAKGSSQGGNIFLQIKNQKDANRKFYNQYLKSLEIFTKCIQNQNLEIEGAQNLINLYQHFKKSKFEFPQNLMAKRIQTQFHQNLQYNHQRNMQMLKKIKSQTSISALKKRQNNSELVHQKIHISQLNDNIQECLQQFLKLPESQQKIDQRMNRLLKFKNNFEKDIDNVDDNMQIKQSQMQEIIDNGLELTKNIQIIQQFYKKYKNKQINFNDLVRQHSILVKDEDDQTHSRLSLKHSPVKESKQITDQVISSFKPPEIPIRQMNHTSPVNSLSNQVANQSKVPKTTAQNNPVMYRQQTFGNTNISGSNSLRLQNIRVSEYNHSNLGNKTNLNLIIGQTSNNAYQLTAPIPITKPTAPINKNSSQIKQQQILNQVTSSILSSKSKNKQKHSGQRFSNLSKNQQKKSYSKIQSGSTLKERMEKRKQGKKRNSQLEQDTNAQFILASNSNQNINRQINHQVHKPNSKMLNQKQQPAQQPNSYNQHYITQYVDYNGPPSFRMPKANQTAPISNNNVATQQVKSNTFSNFNQNNGKNYIQNENIPIIEIKQPSKIYEQIQQINEVQNLTYQTAQHMQVHKSKQVSKIQKKIVTGSGFKGTANQRSPQYKTAGQKQYDDKLYKMYKTQLISRNNTTYTRPIQEQQQNKIIKKESQNQYNFADQLKRPARLSANEYNSSSIAMPGVQNQSYHTCKLASQKELQLQQNRNKIGLPQQIQKEQIVTCNNNTERMGAQNQPILMSVANPYIISSQTNNQANNFTNKQANRQNVFTQSRDMKQSRNIYNVVIDDDIIREPQITPLQNSYYGIKEIQQRVRNSPRPQFKNCFQIDKQVIPSSIRNPGSSTSRQTKYYSNNLPQSLSNQSNITKLPKHQQYLIAKLRKQYELQEQSETKKLQKRVIQLKTDSSRLRNQIINKQNQYLVVSRKRSDSNSSESSFYSSSVVAFSNTKSNQSNSPSSFRLSRMGISTVSSILKSQGTQINEENYQRFLSEISDDKFKKCCIRNKSLIIKNDLIEIGCTFKKIQDCLKLGLYLTPSVSIGNFSYSISKQPNLQIQSYCKDFSGIPANKQIKVQIQVRLKNIPYNLPIVNIGFLANGQQKNVSFYLPITFNKFINMSVVDPISFDRVIAQNSRKLLKTQQIKWNSKVLKVNNINEQFPNFTQLKTNQQQNTVRYGTKCLLKNSNFFVVLTIKGKQKTLIQVLPEGQSVAAEFYMLTLMKILQL